MVDTSIQTGLDIIVFTPESPIENESLKIMALLQSGISRVHLRHPSVSDNDIKAILDNVDKMYYPLISLHDHFSLTKTYPVGGLHLNRRNPVPPHGYTGCLSQSCHTIDEVKQSSGMDYVTLSPIFDSISKPGYRSSFRPADLEKLTASPVPVYALGGVTSENIESLRHYNFAGAALLGAIDWNRISIELKTDIKC